MSISYSTQIPLYGTTLKLQIAEQPEFDEYAQGDSDAFVLNDGGISQVFLRKAATPGVIAHEALHITKHVLERAGVRLSNKSEEPYAYLLGWVVDWLCERVALARKQKS